MSIRGYYIPELAGASPSRPGNYLPYCGEAPALAVLDEESPRKVRLWGRRNYGVYGLEWNVASSRTLLGMCIYSLDLHHIPGSRSLPGGIL
jgi:hypothetical protein